MWCSVTPKHQYMLLAAMVPDGRLSRPTSHRVVMAGQDAVDATRRAEQFASGLVRPGPGCSVRIGVSPSAVYHHFDSPDVLACALSERVLAPASTTSTLICAACGNVASRDWSMARRPADSTRSTSICPCSTRRMPAPRGRGAPAATCVSDRFDEPGPR